MTTPTPAPSAPIETIGTYFLGLNTVHGIALQEHARRRFSEEGIAEAATEGEPELRRALMTDWYIRDELQAKIGMEEYVAERMAELVEVSP